MCFDLPNLRAIYVEYKGGTGNSHFCVLPACCRQRSTSKKHIASQHSVFGLAI